VSGDRPGVRAAAVECRGVRVRLGGRPVLDGVDLTVPSSSWCTVVGPNGAGKSTLLRALSGVVRFRGEVEVEGRRLEGIPPRDRARLVSLLPQNPIVPPGMTVAEYVMLGRTPYIGRFGAESTHDLEVTEGVLRRLDLWGFATRPLDELSGGERQRVLVARVVAQQAPIVPLDEPTTALDLGHQRQVLELLDEVRRTDGWTVVATMHDLTVAGLHGEQVVLLRDGRVAATGTAREVLTADRIMETYGTRVVIVEGPRGPAVLPA